MFGFIPQTVQFVSLWSPCERFRWLKASPRNTDYHARGFVDFFLFSHHLFEAHKLFMLVICHLFKILSKEGNKIVTHHYPPPAFWKSLIIYPAFIISNLLEDFDHLSSLHNFQPFGRVWSSIQHSSFPIFWKSLIIYPAFIISNLLEDFDHLSHPHDFQPFGRVWSSIQSA